MKPKRLQLLRRKGWRLPETAVKVARPGKWGNTFTVQEHGEDAAVANHRQRLELQRSMGALDLSELRGKDLACWCKLCHKHGDGLPLGEKCDNCQPCHADTLLEMSNSG